MFKKGDLVRLKTGNSPQRVMAVSKDSPHHVGRPYPRPSSHCRIRTQYMSQEEPNGWRKADDYVLIPSACPPEEEESMPTLYETKELPPRFGTKIATNSKMEIVLEMKGEGGVVEAFPADQLEEVLPYTVNLEPIDQGISSIHIICQKGQVAMNNVLIELNSGKLWRVTKLDTASRSPKENKSKWLLLQTTKLEFG